MMFALRLWAAVLSAATLVSSSRYPAAGAVTSTSTAASVKTATASPTNPTIGGNCPLIKPKCSPSGFNLAYYPNPFGGFSRPGSLPWNYYLTQKLSPLETGFTSEIFYPRSRVTRHTIVYPDPNLPDYGYYIGWVRDIEGILVDANNFTMVYEGFYQAPATGSYKFCVTALDEVDFFIGHGSAFSCLTGNVNPKAKPQLTATAAPNDATCINYSMVKGQYYPWRVVSGNWYSVSSMDFKMTPPGQDEPAVSDFSNFAYPRSCGVFSKGK